MNEGQIQGRWKVGPTLDKFCLSRRNLGHLRIRELKVKKNVKKIETFQYDVTRKAQLGIYSSGNDFCKMEEVRL